MTLKVLLVIFAALIVGYMANENNGIHPFSPANANISGKTSYDLAKDPDFILAVKRVVHGNCYVPLGGIYVSC